MIKAIIKIPTFLYIKFDISGSGQLGLTSGKKTPTFLYIKFDISGSGQLGLTSGWLRSQQPFIHLHHKQTKLRKDMQHSVSTYLYIYQDIINSKTG